jgi:hypothetical protein
MTRERTTGNPADADADVARLLSLAGRRPRPPRDVEARVRAATLAAFEALPEPAAGPTAAERNIAPEKPGAGGKRFRSRLAWGLAASVLVGLVVGRYLVEEVTPPAGEILFATGGYTVRGSPVNADALAAGAIVRTSSEGRLLIGLGPGREVRIDHGSSLTLHSDSEIWLHSGRIYLDLSGPRSVVVVTPFATVTDTGTRFEVQVREEHLTVATREGAVDVSLGDETIHSAASPSAAEELVIDRLTVVGRNRLPTTGARWAWTQSARPLFSVADHSVREYLVWAARESGRQLEFASDVASQQADLRRLGGSGEVDADAASVERVLAASAFRLRSGDAGRLIVELR